MVLDLPGVTFFSLLNEAYRLDAASKLSLMNVFTFPKLDEQDRDDLVRAYKRSASSPLEILDDFTYTGETGLQQLKDALGGVF